MYELFGHFREYSIFNWFVDHSGSRPFNYCNTIHSLSVHEGHTWSSLKDVNTNYIYVSKESKLRCSPQLLSLPKRPAKKKGYYVMVT